MQAAILSAGRQGNTSQSRGEPLLTPGYVPGNGAYYKAVWRMRVYWQDCGRHREWCYCTALLGKMTVA